MPPVTQLDCEDDGESKGTPKTALRLKDSIAERLTSRVLLWK